MNQKMKNKIDHEKFQALVKQLYSTVKALEEMFDGRKFTPDGHMVGSLGECLVADAYALELKTASNKGFDALTKDGREVEIKATQSKAVAFRCEPQHTIIIEIRPNGTFKEVYNGPGSLVWDLFRGKKVPSNGQFQVSLTKLRQLNELVSEAERIPQVL